MRIRGVASATSILLIAGRLDHNRIVERACMFPSTSGLAFCKRNLDRLWPDLLHTFAGSIQWLHIEDINTLHLPQNF